MCEVAELQLTLPRFPLSVALTIDEGRAEWEWERTEFWVVGFLFPLSSETRRRRGARQVHHSWKNSTHPTDFPTYIYKS